jgi:ferric-dicitrate binding protein FerR (iron transport regulator)
MQRTDESDDMVPSEKGAQLRKEALRWVIRLHGGGMSPEDRRAFDAWYAQSAAHAHMSNGLHSMGQRGATCGCRRCREIRAVFIQHKDGVALLICGLAMVCMVLFVIAGNISIQQCTGA